MSLHVDIEKRLDKFTLGVKLETCGGVTGMLGASGAGKSMTLKCIAGIEKPDKGKIVLDGVTLFDSGRRINLPPQSRKVGYLFQNYALFPNMTVRQNILCGLKSEKDGRKRERALGEILELMRLEGLERRRPYQLSGGEQQRVALARILSSRPRLLMLDEPFSALDSHLRGQLQAELHGILTQFGRDALMVTHNQDEAAYLCERIARIDEGRLVAIEDTKARQKGGGPPIISIIGYSGSGKTTLIEKLIPLLVRRNIRVGVIKHDAHRFEIDREGKDTWRFSNAGAKAVAIASAEKSAVMFSGGLDLDTLTGMMRDVDLIITEGYKAGDKPKIEVHREASGKQMYEKPENLLAIVTDAPVETDTPLFDLNDAEGLAEFLERMCRG